MDAVGKAATGDRNDERCYSTLQEAVDTGYVSYELEHLITLGMKLKKLVDAGVLRPAEMCPECHGQEVISIPTREEHSKQP